MIYFVVEKLQNDIIDIKNTLDILFQSQSLSLSAQQQQLQQLQMLQQQLMQQSQLLQAPQSAQPVIDGGLLSQIQALTSQLLQRTQEQETTNPPEPATFNKVRMWIHSSEWSIYVDIR